MLLEDKLVALEQLVKQMDKQNDQVSASSVGWHIDHSLKVIIKTCQAVKKSDPKDYKWRFNFSRLYVFMMGSFPRGVARAPKSVVADGEILADDLSQQLGEAKILVAELNKLPKMSNFNHPYFGMVHLSQVIKFLRIHTNHHGKIISDIIASNRKS